MIASPSMPNYLNGLMHNYCPIIPWFKAHGHRASPLEKSHFLCKWPLCCSWSYYLPSRTTTSQTLPDAHAYTSRLLFNIRRRPATAIFYAKTILLCRSTWPIPILKSDMPLRSSKWKSRLFAVAQKHILIINLTLWQNELGPFVIILGCQGSFFVPCAKLALAWTSMLYEFVRERFVFVAKLNKLWHAYNSVWLRSFLSLCKINTGSNWVCHTHCWIVVAYCVLSDFVKIMPTGRMVCILGHYSFGYPLCYWWRAQWHLAFSVGVFSLVLY
jgi:hypothetical protein